MAEERLVEEFGDAVLDSGISQAELAERLLGRCRQTLVRAADFPVALEHLQREVQLWTLVYSISAGAEGSIADWIAQFLPEPRAPAKLPAIKWQHLQAAGHGLLDEDAPLRGDVELDAEDRAADSDVFEYVFALLLRGETSAAADLCSQTGNWLLRAAIEASSPRTPNPVLVEACRVASESSLSAAERGVYGLLGKQLASVAPLCRSWDELLLAYLRTESPLDRFEAAVQADPALAVPGMDFRRRIVIALASGTFAALARELLADEAALLDIALVRVVLHVQMVLECVTEPAVKLYVLHLCSDPARLAERLVYVPGYVKELERSEQPALYGQVLAELISPEQIAQQLELSREFGIDLPACLAHAVNLCLDLYTENVGDEFVGMRVVRCVVSVLDARLYAQSLRELVRAYELFLTHEDVRAARALTSAFDLDALRRDTFDARQLGGRSREVLRWLVQLRQYKELVAAFSRLEEGDCSSAGAAATSHAVFAALEFDGPDALRQRCVPRLVYGLLALVDADDEHRFAGVAARLVEALADERRQLYRFFDRELMHRLVGPYLAARA